MIQETGLYEQHSTQRVKIGEVYSADREMISISIHQPMPDIVKTMPADVM
jgi:hypothetical protein